MKLLKDILYKVPIKSVFGSTDIYISDISYDSRKVTKGNVFVAIKGVKSDGHQFIDKAIEKGVSVIVHEDSIPLKKDGITYVRVQNSAKALAFMAANNYDQPSQNLKLVGVTGTNGKTTVASLLYELFRSAGFKVGLLSTVKIVVNDQVFPATHTTPDSIVINNYLKKMNDVGVEFCFMEVSSHGIAQQRIEGLVFEGGVFTNLSHDHLDYHHTFSAYRDVKQMFFDQLPKSSFALTNLDDKNGLFMVQNTRAKVHSYALKSYADFRVQILENQFKGQLLKINDLEIWVKLIGSFNAYNLAAIFACAKILGLATDEILKIGRAHV